NSNERFQEQINLANSVVLWLKDHIRDDELINEKLIDPQGRILTSLFNTQNPIAAYLKDFSLDIFPLTGVTQIELFSGA
ncbi:hypothetical protein CWB63_18695, partial [Pseudoalteromonas sp. S409]|uniref:hypothetical protein n=1 Tax=Pseudoalteromonas sp. S409 TaxID=2066518 RepID=UPI0011098620